MDLSKMTPEEARAIVMQAQNVFDASIADQQRTTPKEIQSLPLDLSVERTRSNAMKVSFPFKSILVEQATDLNTYIYIIPISNDSGNDPIRMGLKDIYKNEFGFRECYIYWDAQGAKSILLKFFVRSFLENGRLVLDQNSLVVNKSVGYSTAQDDGFTIVTTSLMELQNTVGATFITGAIATNDVTYSNGNITLPAGQSSNRIFKVPQGYICELLSCSILTYKASLNTTAWKMYACAVNNNSNIPDFNSLDGKVIGSLTSLGDVPKSTTPFPIELSCNSSPTIELIGRNRKILNEDECLLLAFYNESAIAVPIINNIRIMCLLRLTKKVV